MAATRFALITGAAQGIGAAIALRLADDNIDVAVFDIKGQEEKLDGVVKAIEAKGRRGLAIVGDVSVEEDVKGAVDKVVEVFGGLDIMIANAGVAKLGTIVTATTDTWKSTMGINVDGVFYCYKYAAIQMIKQGRGGRIIGACSGAGKRPIPNLLAYSTSKFAVRGLTQAAAQELAQYNIQVNAYAPGWIMTAMVADEQRDAKFGGEPGAFLNHAIGDSGGIKGAEPEVIAELVAYMVKPQAYFMTGQSVCVNGGYFMD
ncbi:acetoin reductase family protein [Abortiporus biennis]|nr:acetoin reductase family protein [Abortiporus biennis]